MTHRRHTHVAARFAGLGILPGLVLVLGLVLPLGLSGCREKPQTPQVTINGRSWYADVARTPQELYTGLGGRPTLPADVGMLFIFPEPRELTFCMRDCEFPIDVAFISADMKVVSVRAMAVEPDRAGRVLYPSGGPAKYAFEVLGGGLTSGGIKAGDAVQFAGIDH